MTRRKFLDTTLAGGATLIAGGSTMIFAANSPAVTELGTSSVFRLGGDLPLNRLGFGAMRITGEGIWGWPADRGNASRQHTIATSDRCYFSRTPRTWWRAYRQRRLLPFWNW